MAIVTAIFVGDAPAEARRVVARGDLHTLVVLASFPDRELSHPASWLSGRPDATLDRLVSYWTEVSGGRLRIVPHVGTVPITLSSPRATYVNQPARMAAEAVTAFASAATDIADRTALREATALLVVFAGAGRESHVEGGDPGDPWSNYAGLVPPREGFEHAVVLAEEEMPPFSNVGVLCHEFGHLLGLPELYATGGARQEGIGVWGLMGQGTWLDKGNQPPHLEAWSRIRLGWADVVAVDASTRRIELPAVERTPRVLRIPASAAAGEYYLVENRQRIAADAALPGAGLLVWHVNEGATGFRTAQNDVARPLLRLVQADGREDLERGHRDGGNRGDAGDPWAGPGRPRRLLAIALAVVATAAFAAAMAGFRARRYPPVLGGVLVGLLCAAVAVWLVRAPRCGPTTPGMAPYDGTPGRVTLSHFSGPGDVMSFDVDVAP